MDFIFSGDLVLDELRPEHWLSGITPALRGVDLVVGHLEVPHTRRGSELQGDVPAPAADPDHLGELREAGFHVLTLAGNHMADCGAEGIADTKLEQFPVNPGRTPAQIGRSHFPDKLSDFMTDAGFSRTFGFEFPKKLKTLSVPMDNGIRFYNDMGFVPSSPNAGEQYPEEPIRHSNFRPIIRPFRTANCWRSARFSATRFDVILIFDHMSGTRIRSVFIMILACQACQKIVNHFSKYEYL